ncbi:hypothetical protein [Dethiothermospora halolimnae]|uniref:hypothetical protein n=1 Tax=Dethiothermospora halolimnae TaxID=3114390 RepID=UPI003CCB967F
MSKRFKGSISIFFLATSFFMMFTTEHTRALGDYILEFIGLRSWTGEYIGTHLTIFYFLPLTVLGLFLVNKYAIRGWGIKGRNVLIIFVVLIIGFTSVTNITAKIIKRNSDGLLSIGFDSESSIISFESEDMKYTEFNANIVMTNYGKEERKFYLTIVSPFPDSEKDMLLNVYKKSGERAIFRLKGNETKTFKIDLDNYDVGKNIHSSVISGEGSIEEIILVDVNSNNKVKLNRNNFFGTELNR